MRVPHFLKDQDIPFESLAHPPAFTAQRRAKYLGVPGKQVAKCVLLAGPGGPILAVLAATHRVDLHRVGQALGGPARLASEAEVAGVFRDCEWGALTALGKLYGLTTLLDSSLDPEALIVIPAHFHATAIRMRCQDFERLETPRRLAFGCIQGPHPTPKH
jgi:Ala-tRNA(Pro) deacylase